MAACSSSADGGPDRLLLDILEAVADARDEEITALPPVIEFFDPNELEEFVDSTTVPTTVILDVYDCQVKIDGKGDVTAIRNGN